MEQEDRKIVREPIRFASSDAATTLHGFIWRNEGRTEYAGVVQIAHGMAEHITRYDDFARYLARAGYVVCGHDQLGHGESCDPARYGKLPARQGKDFLVDDLHRLRALMRERHAGIPYFVFGHSLGSYLMRAYIARHGQGLAGCILCGTGHVPPAVSRGGHLLALGICRLRGEDTCSEALDKLGAGGYNRAIPDARTDYDWLSRDVGNVDRYIADPACGFMFSAGGYAVVTALTAEVCTKKSFTRVPKSLPVLFVSGSEDPVGNNGAGVRTAAAQARDAGLVDVSCKLYDGMRHEILNEKDHDRVYGDIRTWLDGHLA